VIDLDLNSLNFENSGGFVTVVAQDVDSGMVLMVARADRDCLERTIASGEMHYHSRVRGRWHKGATSGNVQRVVSLAADCDGDAVLALVRPAGPSCHTGSVSCFGAPAAGALSVLDGVIAARAAVHDAKHDANSPSGASGAHDTSYTRKLLGDRNLRLKKLGEEVAELIVAIVDADVSRSTEEAADVFYHVLVALHAIGVSLDDVRTELARRAGPPER
jgi:phosphoribosyl-ATP pyrophosphohydrolase/phosphoribosyl-AMP cyclohydrolase